MGLGGKGQTASINSTWGQGDPDAGGSREPQSALDPPGQHGQQRARDTVQALPTAGTRGAGSRGDRVRFLEAEQLPGSGADSNLQQTARAVRSASRAPEAAGQTYEPRARTARRGRGAARGARRPAGPRLPPPPQRLLPAPLRPRAVQTPSCCQPRAHLKKREDARFSGASL